MEPDIAVDGIDPDRLLIRLREDPSLVGVDRCVGLVIMPTSSSGRNFRLLRNAGPSPKNSDGVEARLRLRLRTHVGDSSRRVGIAGGVPSMAVGVEGGVDEDDGGMCSR